MSRGKQACWSQVINGKTAELSCYYKYRPIKPLNLSSLDETVLLNAVSTYIYRVEGA